MALFPCLPVLAWKCTRKLQYPHVSCSSRFFFDLEPNHKDNQFSRAFCDPGPQSNQIMSAAQHLALKNTIQIRARIMEIGANYKMALSDSEITFLKNNLLNFERRGNLIIVITIIQ